MEENNKASFCIRRNSAVAQLKQKVGFSMRFRWCQKFVSWVEHIRRHHDSLAYAFSTAQGDDWLRERRTEVGAFGISQSLDAGETRTRSGRGVPHRFFSGWLEALDARCDGLCTNPRRDKAFTVSHANMLYSIIFVTPEHLALMDEV